jgi:trk system potassium uptake protein TrkH
MSVRHLVNIIGLLLVFVSIAMAATGLGASFYEDGAAFALFASSGITLLVGIVAYSVTKFEGEITTREGYAIVTFAWTAMAVFGALPFLISGTLDGILPAIFEAMSGFTTTGATVFTDVEALPEGILLWRSVTHWLGGMGIIVLAIAILPYVGVGGMQLFRAEVPGPTSERLRPRITQTAKLLWGVYVGLTGVQIVLYRLGGMSLFDSVNHAFATLATGGFSTKNTSLAGFDSAYLHYVTIVFMYIAGVNFALHFRAATGRLEYFKNEEWRFFTMVILGAGFFLMVSNLMAGTYELTVAGVEGAFRHGMFQSVSITTTTGFVSADFEMWVPAAQGLLVTLMFVGGMAGSTGGGIKAVRVLVLLRHTASEIRKHLHPRAILMVRVSRHTVREDVLLNILGFVSLYILLVLFGGMLLTFFGMDILTAVGASAASVGNIGPGLGAVGATDNYGWISDPGLAVIVFLMLVGRLEIYTVLLLFHPDTWKRQRAQSLSKARTVRQRT